MIEINDVMKRYGNNIAVNRLSLEIPENGVYCLLGRNGAGKTTLMNLIAGKIPVSAGEILIDGEKVSALDMPENVRYIEAAKRQFNMGVKELFGFAAAMDEKFDIDFAMDTAGKFRLDIDMKYNSLSFGMKTMVTTIISLSGKNDAVLLDEPVLGMDAVVRTEFYKLLCESCEKNPRIIIVSTHLIDEIAGIANRIIMLEKGRLIFNEDINSVAEKSYKITGPADEAKKAAERLNVVAEENLGKYAAISVFDKRISAGGNLDISDMPLQELFVKIAGGMINE